MNKLFHQFLGAVLLLCIGSCQKEFHPLAPPLDLTCKAPSIEQNIVGTWRFISTYDLPASAGANVQGTITFTAQKTLLDPDSLFRMHYIDTKPQTETYEPMIRLITPGGDFGDVFAIYLQSSKGTQIDAFQVASNTCNQIRLLPSKSTSDQVSIILVR